MEKGACLVCFTKSNRIVSILNTHLQAVFEHLTDLKLQNENHFSCFNCARRLQQCYELEMKQTLTLQQYSFYNGDNEIKNVYGALNSSKRLPVTKATAPCEFEILEEKTIKQEKNKDVVDLNMKSYNFNGFQVQEIKIEIDPFDYLSSDTKSRCSLNLEIEKDKLRENPMLTNIKIEKLDMDEKTITNSVHKYTCDLCPFETNIENSLCDYHLTHSQVENDELYECKYCPYVSETKSNLLSHTLIHSSKLIKLNKSYTCDVCNKTYSDSSGLIKHKRTHTGEKPFTCDMCSKRFSVSSSLLKHKRTHTGDKPYSCDVCNKSFAVSGSLITHKRTHTGDKPYSCKVCNKTFSRNSHLITHQRTHTGDKPYSCNACNKTFSDSSSLIRHKRTHTGDKPYACYVCTKTFSDSSGLIKHKRTHTGEKPYDCNVCNKTFSVSSSLLKHKKIHTGNKPLTISLNIKETFT